MNQFPMQNVSPASRRREGNLDALGLRSTFANELNDPHLWWWSIALVLICAYPAVLMLFGVDFATACSPLRTENAASLSLAELTDVSHRALRGSFTHTLLEWTAVCAAFFVGVLALVQFRMTREPSLPVIGLALVCAGTMDAFHTFAADRLLSSVTDTRNLIPFTWAICRIFNALILLFGVGIFAFSKKRQVGLKGTWGVAFASAGFIAVSYVTVYLCATSDSLPQTMFPGATIKRPYDLLPLVPYLLCGLFVFPKYLRQHPTWFAYSLFLSLIPQIATQLYMSFGSFRLHDSAFNIAHAIKALAYSVPMVGLAAGYLRTHEQREQGIWALSRAHDLLEARVDERTAELHQVNASLEAENRQRWKAEQALQESESRMRTIVETAAEGIITINDQGIVESFNVAASHMFGYDPQDIVGQNISLLMPAPHRQRHDEYLARYRKTGQRKIIGISREVEAQRKDGTIFPADIAVSEVRRGDHSTFTGIVRDLTERKKLQVQLGQSQKMESIGQLAAGIAHEINTPTQYIGDNTRFLQDVFRDLSKFLDRYDELLQATKINAVTSQLITNVEDALRDVDPEYLKQEIPIAIKQSLEGVEHITKIVRAMKEFSRSGSNEKIPIDINQSIESTVAIAASEWRYIAEVVMDLDPSLPRVPCIPGDMNQVILHLIVNAAHAIADTTDDSGKKGAISVSTRNDDGWVELRISDTGSGIPVDVQSRMFDPFFTTKEVGKGTGQGLPICYAIVVEKHGGSIEFETSVGRGTDFVVRLPVESRGIGEQEPQLEHVEGKPW